MRVSFTQSGSFDNLEKYLRSNPQGKINQALHAGGQLGVNALSAATPVDSSLTASSWNYEIKSSKGSAQIVWTNSNVVDGVPIAIILQYGHGTGTGGYVEGTDYINPAMKPVFDKIAENVWKAVKSA